MADEGDNRTPEPEPATEEELLASEARVRETLKRREVELRCPMCGHDYFIELTDVAIGVISDRHNTDPGPLQHGSLHAFVYACGRCGFMSMLDYRTLDAEDVFDGKQ